MANGERVTHEKDSASYTFQSDRAFFHPADFRGMTFHPSEHRSGGDTDRMPAGALSISFKQTELKITGVEGLDSAYYLADIQKTQEGFIAEILDRKHPSVPFHLLIHTDEESFVKGFTLYTLEQGRHDFLLPDRPAVDRARLDELYTKREQFFLETYDSTFFFDFVPFLFEAHVALQSGIEIMDGETHFLFSPDSVSYQGAEGNKSYSIKEIEHSISGEPGQAGTRYRVGLHLRSGGKKGEKVYMALYMDAWHHLEYVAWGPSRYYPRP